MSTEGKQTGPADGKVQTGQRKRRLSSIPKCGAQTRADDKHPCRRAAGHGTDHLGSGRCKFHGGMSPRKHGLYSMVVPTALRRSYQEVIQIDIDKKAVTKKHLALLDGVIIPTALKRGTKAPKIPGLVDPLVLQMKALDVRSKVAKRLHDMEDTSKLKLTQSDLEKFISEIVSAVAQHVDMNTLNKIAASLGVHAPAALSRCHPLA